MVRKCGERPQWGGLMPIRPAAQHRATRRHRGFGVLCGILLTPVVVVAAVYLTGGGGFLRLDLTQSGPQASPGHGKSTHAPGHSPSAAGPTPSPSSVTTTHPAARHRLDPGPPKGTSSPGAGRSSTSPPTGSPASQEPEAVSQVLALINQARSQAGLAPYTITAGLDSSSAAHNARMADGCGLSHQCPGEPPLGTRETDAGVVWTAAGENIGEGGPVADSASAIAQMAATLTQDMLNEKPPDDGHRLNILSSTFTHIGIAVTIDGSGTVWMTQDFSN
jgi:uncharacterized protein YkwD